MKKQFSLVLASMLLAGSASYAINLKGTEREVRREGVAKPGEATAAGKAAEGTRKNERHARAARAIETVLKRGANTVNENNITAFSEIPRGIMIERKLKQGETVSSEAIGVRTSFIVDGYMSILENPRQTAEQRERASLGRELISKAGQIEMANDGGLTSEAVKFLRDHVMTVESLGKNDGLKEDEVTTGDDIQAYSDLIRTAISNTKPGMKLHEVYKSLDEKARERQKNCEEKA